MLTHGPFFVSVCTRLCQYVIWGFGNGLKKRRKTKTQVAQNPGSIEPQGFPGCIFFGNKRHVGAKSALLRRLFMPGAKKTSSARSLAPPLQPRPAALGSQLGPPCGCLFPGNFGFHRSFHVGAKSALLRRLFLPEQKRRSPAPQRFVRKLQPSASRQKRSLQRKRPTGGDIPVGNQTVLFPHAPGCIPPPPGSPSPGKKPASLRRNDWRDTVFPRPDFWPNLPRK